MGRSNTLNDLSNRVCVPDKTEDLKLNGFNLITGINKSKTLIKHISLKCECKFDGKCTSYQKWSIHKCQCECKNYQTRKEDYSWILIDVFVRMVSI